MSTRWEASDKDIKMVFNFTEQREAVNITTNFGGAGSVQIENNTLAAGTKSGDYQLRNATEVREFEILLNGKDKTREKLLVRPLECILGQCPIEAVEDINLPDKASPWSNKDSWGGVLPVDGDEVEIKNNMWIELDLKETPKLKKLTINGRLTVKSDKDNLPDIKLQSKLIWVRSGELLVGTAEAPFEQNFVVELQGETEDETLTLDGLTKAGNKVIVSNNKIEMFGKKRTNISRMIEAANAGDEKIKVAADVDWVAGDRIFLATSTIQHDHGEFHTIKAIDKGEITLETALKFYHYGTKESTATSYNGVDIRNEVLLLTRNVKIMGEKKDGWAGHILVSDLIEGENTRYGTMTLESVQVENCSQKDLSRGAIRFEGATHTGEGKKSKITNCAVHEGDDWGLFIDRSNNIEISDTAFISWRAVGVSIDTSENLIFNRNFIGHTRERVWTALGMAIDKAACVALGTYTNKAMPSKNLEMKDNIAAGCVYAGFMAPSLEACGGTFDKYKGNVAHSSTRYGVYAYTNPLATKSAECTEWGHFSAYKT